MVECYKNFAKNTLKSMLIAMPIFLIISITFFSPSLFKFLVCLTMAYCTATSYYIDTKLSDKIRLALESCKTMWAEFGKPVDEEDSDEGGKFGILSGITIIWIGFLLLIVLHFIIALLCIVKILMET